VTGSETKVNPKDSREAFDNWMNAWSKEQNAAAEKLNRIRHKIWKENSVKAYEMEKTGTLPAEYYEALENYNEVSIMTSVAERILNWVENQGTQGKLPTFYEINEEAKAEVRAKEINETFIAPVCFGFIAWAMMQPAEVSSPKNVGKGARFVFDARTGQYRDLETGRFVSPKDLPWPEYPGFEGTPKNVTLQPGMVIDRYGNPNGEFAITPGTTISQRGLPPGSENTPYTKYMVTKPVTVPAGPAAGVSEFGATGGATQYWFKGGMYKYLDYLSEVP
jgi:hypothetical protein